MIIDVHGHLGEDVVFDEQQTEEQLLDAYKKNGVDGAIIQPYLPRIYMEDHVRIHDRIYEMTKCKEKRFWGWRLSTPTSGQKSMIKRLSDAFEN